MSSFIVAAPGPPIATQNTRGASESQTTSQELFDLHLSRHIPTRARLGARITKLQSFA